MEPRALRQAPFTHKAGEAHLAAVDAQRDIAGDILGVDFARGNIRIKFVKGFVEGHISPERSARCPHDGPRPGIVIEEPHIHYGGILGAEDGRSLGCREEQGVGILPLSDFLVRPPKDALACLIPCQRPEPHAVRPRRLYPRLRGGLGHRLLHLTLLCPFGRRGGQSAGRESQQQGNDGDVSAQSSHSSRWIFAAKILHSVHKCKYFWNLHCSGKFVFLLCTTFDDICRTLFGCPYNTEADGRAYNQKQANKYKDV